MSSETDSYVTTAAVDVRLDRLERTVGKGTLVALAHVTLTVGDIEMRIRGSPTHCRQMPLLSLYRGDLHSHPT